jgi:Domain of unknown function (DUF4192)
MNPTESPTLRVRGPADLLGAVPYLLGFHPEESLVVIGLDDTTVTVTARINLPDIHVLNVLPTLFAAVNRSGATRAVLVVFTDSPVDRATASSKLSEHVERAGLGLVDSLLVSHGRWWSLACEDSGCCPAEGSPMPAAPTELHAAATYAGLTALPSRDALAAMFGPLSDRTDLAAELVVQQDIEVNAALVSTHDTFVRAATRALFAAHRAAQGGEMPTDRDVARYGIALQSFAVRDAVWMALDDDRLEGIELWVNLARRLPAPYSAAPLFLAGWRAWRDGNGALAGIAAERALASDPGYSAADLLLAALARGIDPRTLPKLRLPAQSKGAAEPDSNA